MGPGDAVIRFREKIPGPETRKMHYPGTCGCLQERSRIGVARLNDTANPRLAASLRLAGLVW